MLTVPDAARRVNRDPETIRRWIRSGRLRTNKVGTQYVIEEADLLDLLAGQTLPLPLEWTITVTGEPMPDVVGWLRRSRSGH